MTPKEVIRLGTLMGLSFNEDTNFPDSLQKGRIVFDGHNGQRFLIESTWSEEDIYEVIGRSLISLGKRLKACEINEALSIFRD